jgi:hypothetical protein
MLGATWTRTLDGALDHISQLTTERDNALDEITTFLREHPEHEDDEHLTLARLALL